MAYLSVSHKFTQTEMEDGTAQTWVQTFTITTFRAAMVTPLGTATVLYTILYE